uniref:Uncharacterized protein n=1 Tax=Romanomermis culicivorax TaxID=13658 RepID=A0A915IAI0_ROMCU
MQYHTSCKQSMTPRPTGSITCMLQTWHGANKKVVFDDHPHHFYLKIETKSLKSRRDLKDGHKNGHLRSKNTTIDCRCPQKRLIIIHARYVVTYTCFCGFSTRHIITCKLASKSLKCTIKFRRKKIFVKDSKLCRIFENKLIEQDRSDFPLVIMVQVNWVSTDGSQRMLSYGAQQISVPQFLIKLRSVTK